jgi:hypothetical protein
VNDSTPATDRIVGRWIRATLAGWAVGIPAIAGLALIGETIGIGGSQTLVGAGIGLGVGSLQARPIKRLTGAARSWIAVSMVTLALPFLVFDLSQLLQWSWSYSLPVLIACGSVLIGAAQWWLLRPHFRRAWLWIPAAIVAWSAAGVMTITADAWAKAIAPRGILALLVYLALMMLGGVVLGGLTAWPLRWIVAK